MTTIKILYNDSYDADFGFSEELEAAYKARTGRDINTTTRLYRIGADSVRRDPVAIALVEELGTERASAPGSYLQIREIPAMFERYWSVEASFGTESINVDVNEAFADVLHNYMDTGDLGVLVTQYRKVKTAVGQMTSGDDAIGLRDSDRTVVTAPTVLKPAADAETEAKGDEFSSGYSYFGGVGESRIGHS
jgi:hypothetical protein